MIVWLDRRAEGHVVSRIAYGGNKGHDEAVSAKIRKKSPSEENAIREMSAKLPIAGLGRRISDHVTHFSRLLRHSLPLAGTRSPSGQLCRVDSEQPVAAGHPRCNKTSFIARLKG